MKICIFFDGQNFYRSLQRYDDTLRVDYDRLAAWITQAVGGTAAMFGGAYYYVGVSPDAPQVVEGFLKGLELRPGYFVKRDPRVRRTGRCPVCATEYEYTTEKRVDTRLVADLIHYAANGAYDAAVVVSGDDDFVPAVEAVNALGKQVWVATWSADELSTDLRVRCFGHIHLSDGIGAFRVDRLPRDRERVSAPTFDLDAETLWLARGVSEPVTLSQGRFGVLEGLPRILTMLRTSEIRGRSSFPRGCRATTPSGPRHRRRRPRDRLPWRRARARHGSRPRPRARHTPEEPRGADAARRPTTDRLPRAGVAALPDTLELVTTEGFDYSSNMMDRLTPYLHPPVGGRALVEIPVSWVLDDAPFFLFTGQRGMQPPGPVLQGWLTEFEGITAAGGVTNFAWIEVEAPRDRDAIIRAIRAGDFRMGFAER